MTEIQTKAGTIIAVEVEDPRYVKFEIQRQYLYLMYVSYNPSLMDNFGQSFKWMPKCIGKKEDGYELLGSLSDISEETASTLVERVTGFAQRNPKQYATIIPIGYANYSKEGEYCITATESLRSLLESKGVDVKKSIIILKKKENG